MTSAGGRCDLSRLSVHGSREEQGELGVRELENADSKFKNRTSPESEVRKAGNGTRDSGLGVGGSGGYEFKASPPRLHSAPIWGRVAV